MATNLTLEKWQRKILILCWLAYASSYLSRTNISIALPGMIASQGWSKTSAGLIGTMFFWVYAVGQLINGAIGDMVKIRPLIFVGLLASSFINLIIGFSSNLILIIILWSFNGFFLSTLWGPIIKAIAVWYPEGQRAKIAVILSFSMIAGYLLTWGVIGQIIAKLSWRWAFWIPAAVVFCFTLIWIVKIRNRPEEVGFVSPGAATGLKEKQNGNKERISFIRLIMDTRLWLIAFTCVAQGIIKDGISLWAPTFLYDTQNLSPSTISIFSMAIPAMSFFGILGASWLNKLFPSNEKKSIVVLISGAALSCILLYICLHANAYITVLLLGITVALMYGANTILLSIIPLKYEKYDKVSSTAGFLDFCACIGSGAAGILLGLIIDNMGWNYVIICWGAAAVSGVISMLFYQGMERNSSSCQSTN